MNEPKASPRAPKEHAFDVAVVIPLYNKEPFIRRTLETVIAQTHRPAEVIIVDDGSNDGSVERIRNLIVPPVRLVRQTNAGPGPARNRGIAEASQPWIAFIDADDLWRPDHLATLAKLSIDVPEAAAVSTGFERVVAEPVSGQDQADGDASAEILDYFGPDNEAFWTSCVAIRRPILRELGGFGAFYPGEDRELWIRLALDHVIAGTQKRTAYYVQGTGGLMEQWDEVAVDYLCRPFYATLDRALRNPLYADRHEAIDNFRRAQLARNVKQALVRGDPATARACVAELERTGRARLGLLRLLTWMPRWLIRPGMAVLAKLWAVLR